jgi:hypothetical protein
MPMKMVLIEIWNVELSPKIPKGWTGLKIAGLTFHRDPVPPFNGRQEIHLLLVRIPQIMEVDPRP